MRVVVLKGGRSLERAVSLRSAARVEDALRRIGHEVEQLLNRAVLAAAPVQRHERDVRAHLLEPVDEVGADVDRVDVVAEALQSVLDLSAGAEGDLALERAAALEQRDAAHCARRRSGSTLGSSAARGLGFAGSAPVSVP